MRAGILPSSHVVAGTGFERQGEPVPTPCRTPAPVLEDDVRWHLAVLDTLLDECVAESDTWAFLAATLLETVQEHLLDLARGAQSVGDRAGSEHHIGGPTLNLDTHLSSTRHFDVSGVNLRLGCSLDDVLPHFRPNQWPLSRCFPDDMQLHPAAEVLRHLSKWQAHCGSPPVWEGLEVFTDGSFDGTSSSWAFLVLGWAGGHVFVVGWDAGCVVTAPEAPLFIGATTHSAVKGELSALFWALVWLAQGPKGSQCSRGLTVLLPYNRPTASLGPRHRITLRATHELFSRPFRHQVLALARLVMCAPTRDIRQMSALMPLPNGHVATGYAVGTPIKFLLQPPPEMAVWIGGGLSFRPSANLHTGHVMLERTFWTATGMPIQSLQRLLRAVLGLA